MALSCPLVAAVMTVGVAGPNLRYRSRGDRKRRDVCVLPET
jgi:hypothetical protein